MGTSRKMQAVLISGQSDPVEITGTVTATNASVGTTGAAVPASAGYVGMNVAGNLTGVPGTVNGVKVDGSAVTQPVSAASLPLPTGAATEGTLVSIDATLSDIAVDSDATATSVDSIDNKTPSLVGGRVPVDGSGVTQPVSGTVAATQSGNWSTKAAGLAKVNQRFIDYSSTNVTDASYVEVIASTAAASQQIYISDTGGYPMTIAVGAAAAEVDQFYIGPGFGGVFSLAIGSGVRISIKCLVPTTTVNSGFLVVSTFG